MPSKSEWRISSDAEAIRVNPGNLEDLGRNWPLDLGIIVDEAAFLETLADGVPARKRDAWVAEIASERAKYEKQLSDEYELSLKASQATGTRIRR
jgi:thiamine pyrophosphate-dependent acetolactate synthase large subunit-like protein